mmetsp:Transcript_33774/g.89513  ORF Transcript_33774/g.89513 Transcript_33774/m.89513 type:complete len:684 (+) Transcript_33774:81-2132(+)
MQLAMTQLAMLAGLVSALASSGESRAAVTPVQKVIQMLGGMLEKGREEKSQEAVLYAAYAQFCTDSIADKTSAVKEADEQMQLLTANIENSETTAETLSREVQESDGEVATWQGNTKATQQVRELERREYDAAHQDYSETIDAITRAVQVLRSQANTKQAPKQVALLASKLDKDSKMQVAKLEVAAFLARGEQDPLDDTPEAYAYETRGGSIVDMINNLKDKFIEERSDLEKEEMTKRHAFELELQDLQASIANAGKERAAKVQQKAHEMQSSADMKGQLTDVTSTRGDDSKFLTDVTTTCKQKEADFQERQQLRADELSAIGKAVEILSGPDVMGSSEKYLSLQQVKQGKKATVLAQLRSVHQSPNQLAVATYLSDQGEKIHSRVLTALALHAREDPFGKVKQMIMDLINRLEEEAGEEAQEKTYCDEELKTNEEQRTAKTADVERIQSSIDEATANVAHLSNEITEHAKQMANTDGEVAELTKIRQKDKAENVQTIKDAQEAQKAVSQAVTVLREFYERSAQSTALLQKQDPDGQPAPPQTFSQPYTGMGGESGGVIAMLEVIQSDYARLESTTSAMEATGQQDFDRQMSESAVLRAQTQRDIEHKTNSRQQKQEALVDYNTDLNSSNQELSTATNVFEKLKPRCLDAGVSFEDRANRRKEEVQSLQEALRILNGEDLATR